MQAKLDQLLSRKFKAIETLDDRLAQLSADLNFLHKNFPKTSSFAKVQKQILKDCKTHTKSTTNTDIKRTPTIKQSKDEQTESLKHQNPESNSNIGSRKEAMTNPSFKTEQTLKNAGKKTLTVATSNPKNSQNHFAQKTKEFPDSTPLTKQTVNNNCGQLDTEFHSDSSNKKPFKSENQTKQKCALVDSKNCSKKSSKETQLSKSSNKRIRTRITSMREVEEGHTDQEKRLSKSQSQQQLGVVVSVAECEVDQKLNQHLSRINESQEKSVSVEEDQPPDRIRFSIQTELFESCRPECSTEAAVDAKGDGLFECQCQAIASTCISDLSALEPMANIEDLELLDIKDKMFIIEALDTSFESEVDGAHPQEDYLTVAERVLASTLVFLPSSGQSFLCQKAFLRVQTFHKLEELSKKVLILDDTKNTFVKVRLSEIRIHRLHQKTPLPVLLRCQFLLQKTPGRVHQGQRRVHHQRDFERLLELVFDFRWKETRRLA